MKLQPYLNKLASSKEFKDFSVKYPEAFPMAGFFVLDLQSGESVHQIDYYIPKQNKVAAFTLGKSPDLKIMEGISKVVPERLDSNANTDIDALEGILEDEMHNRSMTEEIKKIIAILQTIKGKRVWNLNCVLSGMEILRAHVDDSNQTVLKMEKVSIMKLIQKMPAKQQKAISQQEDMQEESKDPKVIEEQIKKLNTLEQEIEKEKAELKGKLKSPKSSNSTI